MVVRPEQVKGDFEPVSMEVPTVPEVIITDGAMVANPVVADKLYKDWQKEQELKKKRVSSGFCSCVIYAKALTGYSQPVGNARNWPKNISYPVVGGVVITNESYAGHVGVITWVNGNDFAITEGNYLRCQKSTRILNTSNPAILGYWQNTNE